MKHLLLMIVSVLIASCAVKNHYDLSENWIDEKSLSAAIEAKSANKWIKDLGRPVVIEIRNDTLLYYYHYKTHLYKTVENGKQFKPTEENRTPYWGYRQEMITLKIVNDSLVGVERNKAFNEVDNNLKTEEIKNDNKWIYVFIGITSLVLLIAITNN